VPLTAVEEGAPLGARLILMCGLPGSGKTTVARELADRLGATRLCPDEWMTDLGIDLFDVELRDRLEVIFWDHAQRLLDLGCRVILESGFWLRTDRDEKRLGARALGVPVELRYLDVPVEELNRRLAARIAGGAVGTVPIPPDLLDQYIGLFQPPDSAEVALFDPPLG
jgi:predicted kinase